MSNKRFVIFRKCSVFIIRKTRSEASFPVELGVWNCNDEIVHRTSNRYRVLVYAADLVYLLHSSLLLRTQNSVKSAIRLWKTLYFSLFSLVIPVWHTKYCHSVQFLLHRKSLWHFFLSPVWCPCRNCYKIIIIIFFFYVHILRISVSMMKCHACCYVDD